MHTSILPVSVARKTDFSSAVSSVGSSSKCSNQPGSKINVHRILRHRVRFEGVTMAGLTNRFSLQA